MEVISIPLFFMKHLLKIFEEVKLPEIANLLVNGHFSNQK